MPFASPHNRLTVYGDAYGGAEIWQFSINYHPSQAPTDANLQAEADAFLPIFHTLWGGSDLDTCQSHRLLGVKVASILATGLYPADSNPGIAEEPVPYAGRIAANAIPQVAVVVTLGTDFRRGLAHAGRFYLPGIQTLPAADGRISATDRNDWLGAVTTALIAVQNTDVGASTSRQIIVASEVGTGQDRDVTEVRMGRVIDTHRSRRNQLDEDYTALPLT